MNLLFPSTYDILFEDKGSKKDLKPKKRFLKLNNIDKKDDKFYDYLTKNLLNDLPISYFENFLKSKKAMSSLANKKGNNFYEELEF